MVALRSIASLLVLAASTACAAEPLSYGGKPIEVATRACLDYLVPETDHDAVTTAVITAGFETVKFNEFAKNFKKDNVGFVYIRKSREQTDPRGLLTNVEFNACMISGSAKTESEAREMIDSANSLVGLPKAGPNVYQLWPSEPPQPIIGFRKMASGDFYIHIELYPKTS